MAQAFTRMGSSVVLVEAGKRVLPREPAAVGHAVGEALEAAGVELKLGQQAARARLIGHDYVLEFANGAEFRGDRLLVATGRRPRTADLGLDTVNIDSGPWGISVDDRLAAGPGLWAVGDVTGLWQLTHVGKYQGRVVADNILGRPRKAHYEAVPRVIFTDPQAASVGNGDGPYKATVSLASVARTATYTRQYNVRPGFLTIISDGDHLTGAYAVGPEAGEWLQQATVAIRAHVPIPVRLDVIQPFPTFSEAFLQAIRDLATTIELTRDPSGSAAIA
jgi:pyruvate/2-oxoglutarate dehydrogenase complex dihydrolipoamide dehydrogenase (E3) component